MISFHQHFIETQQLNFDCVGQVTKRMTDPSQFTGAHRHRFDEFGNGKVRRVFAAIFGHSSSHIWVRFSSQLLAVACVLDYSGDDITQLMTSPN